MQNGRKAVWSIPYISVAFFPSLKQNFRAYRSSKVSWRPDCIFEIHQLWQSGFSRVYSNWCCSCSFEPEIIKIGQSSHMMSSNNILNFQESTTILNACTKKCLETYWIHHVYITNNSIIHQSFVYTQLNVRIVLFLTIRFRISHLLPYSLNIKEFYLTHISDPIRCYHSGPEWTWERWQWRGISHSLKLQHYWSLTMRLFSVISRKLAGRGSLISQ